MPSAITLPTFNDEEILKYETLNSLVQAIQARFTAGIGAADLSWPLTAEGNLDMSVFNIVGGRQIWGFVNAANYDTFEDARSAAGANGVVLVPPETTIAAAAGGHNLAAWSGAIVGAGASSVIQMDSSASASMLRATGGTGGMIANITLDGNSTGTGNSGLDFTGGTNFVIQNVWTKNFTGTGAAGVKVTSGMVSLKLDGYYSTGCVDALLCTGCQNLIINDVRLKNYTGNGLNFNTAGSITRVHMSNAHMETIAGAEGIKFLGSGAVGVGSGAEFHGTNIHIKGATGVKDGMILGTSSAALDRVMLANCTVEDATQHGISINAGRGEINGVDIDNPTSTGIDLDTSSNVNINGGKITGATLGVDSSGITGACRAIGVDYIGCTSNISLGVGIDQWGGTGVLSVGGETSMFNVTPELVTVADGTVLVLSMTIPANTLRVGSVLTCGVAATTNGNDKGHVLRIKLNSVSIATGTVSGAGGTTHLLEVVAMIKTTTTASSQYSLMRGSTSVGPSYTNSIIGLDTTSDQTIEVEVVPSGATSTDGLNVENFVVKLSQGKAYV